MDRKMDFTGEELILLYALAHDHAAECGEFLDSGEFPSRVSREFIQDRIRLTNGVSRKLRGILTDMGIDVSKAV